MTVFLLNLFFDIEHAKEYLEKLNNTEIFIGISPVITENSKNYWTNVNKVNFSKDFELSLSYNSKLAKQLIKLANDTNNHSYIMPIKAPLTTYLDLVFK